MHGLIYMQLTKPYLFTIYCSSEKSAEEDMFAKDNMVYVNNLL